MGSCADQQGSFLVELALTLWLLFVLVFGGLALHQSLSLALWETTTLAQESIYLAKHPISSDSILEGALGQRFAKNLISSNNGSRFGRKVSTYELSGTVLGEGRWSSINLNTEGFLDFFASQQHGIYMEPLISSLGVSLLQEFEGAAENGESYPRDCCGNLTTIAPFTCINEGKLVCYAETDL